MNIIQAPSPNHGGLRIATSGLVIHSTRGGAADDDTELRATLNWFANPTSQVSAHYVVGIGGEVYQCVDETLVAWHAREYNTRWLGIELVQPRPADAYSQAQYVSLAELAVMLAGRFGLPLDRVTIRGHDEIPPGLAEGKTDPGAMFDWSICMATIRGVQNTATQPAAGVNDMTEAELRGLLAELRQAWAIQSKARALIVALIADSSDGAQAVAQAAGHWRRALNAVEAKLNEPLTS